MDYQKTWEVMQGLEDAFNGIITVQTLLDDLDAAVNRKDMDDIQNVTKALMHYVPVYIDKYDRASKRAWNNTVVKVGETDVPYRTPASTERENLYEEVVKYYGL